MAKPVKGYALKPSYSELALEKFFNDYILVWYREKAVNDHTYCKARKEIELLKRIKAKKKGEHELSHTVEEDIAADKGLPKREPSANKKKPPSAPKAGSLVSDANENPHLAKNRGKKSEENNAVINKQETELQQVLWENHELKKKLLATKAKLYNAVAEADVQLNNKDQQLEQLKQNFKNAQSHIEDLTKRLSKMAGDKLRDGNPALADLSDPNRPTELGKKFSEVYDNEWSDAFEKIEGDDEEKKVGMLHGIVKEAFNYCRQKMNDQTKTVRSILLGLEEYHNSEECPQGNPTSPKPVPTANVYNMLKDFRKETAPATACNVAKEYVNNKFVSFTSGFGFSNEKIHESVRKYAIKCTELCWFMVVADPQMALSEDEAGKQFDTNLYRPYTKSVKDLKKPVVKLYVWPALHLHVGGPLVSKGVAQPGEGENTSQA